MQLDLLLCYRGNIHEKETYLLNWVIQLKKETGFHGRKSKYGFFRFGFSSKEISANQIAEADKGNCITD